MLCICVCVENLYKHTLVYVNVVEVDIVEVLIILSMLYCRNRRATL